MVTGANGMLASNIIRSLSAPGKNSVEVIPVTRKDADLRDAGATHRLIKKHRPNVIVHAAARVGGIAANVAQPAEFLMDNLLIDSSVLRSSVDLGIERFLYFGSSCMYPRDYRQPLVEEDVLAAQLEPTNEGYALSKITAAKYCEYVSQQYGMYYRVLVPSNLYGPGDDYTLGRSHLVAAAIAKVHAAKTSDSPSIDVWGDGAARREFTYVADLAEWVAGNLGSMKAWPALMNVGLGVDHSVEEYYRIALDVVGYDATLAFDASQPVGMKQKLMDSSRAVEHGWNPKTKIREGMARAYRAYLDTLT
jgi:GDP-L-fucose synthase